MTNTGIAGGTLWCLECRNLSVQRGGRTVLHDISLTLRRGECLSLIGPNGSGKTTLMLALLGMLPPATGSVCLDGAAMHRLPARRRGRFAAYVPQILEQVSAFSVYDVVAGGRYPHISPLRPLTASDREAVRRALDLSGLSALAQRSINAVSGGERQKTLIAAAIAQDAEAMFLDEPNTALDPAVMAELIGLLHRWHVAGRGIVVISHDLYLPTALGGRVVALRAGRVVADGPAITVLRPDPLKEIYSAEFEPAMTAGGVQVMLPCWERPASMRDAEDLIREGEASTEL